MDCFAAQKSAGLLAMTEKGCHSIMKSAGAVDLLAMTEEGIVTARSALCDEAI